MYISLHPIPFLQSFIVEDTFAHLKQVFPNGDMEFEFVYSVSQKAIVQNNAKTVLVTVNTTTVFPKPLLGQTQRGQVDTKGLVDNIRTATIDAKSILQQQQKYVVSIDKSDIFAYINNDNFKYLGNSVPISSIPSLNSRKLVTANVIDIKQRNDAQPILQMIINSAAVSSVRQAISSSISETPQALMYDMILRQGLDPSYVINLTSRSSSEEMTRGGLSNTQKALELQTDPSSRLLNTYLFSPTSNVPPTNTDELSNSEQVQVLQTVSSDIITIPMTVMIPASKLTLEGAVVTQVYVKFDLIDWNTDLPLASITKVLDLSAHLRVYNTPLVPPSLKASPATASSRINLEVKQIDKSATSINLYKKSIWIADTEIDDYTLVGSYSLSSRDQALTLQLDLPSDSPAIYRAVAVGPTLVQSSEFTNVVARPLRFASKKAISLTATQVDTGVQLELRSIPQDVVAIQLLSWNMSTFDNNYVIVNDDVSFIDDSTRQIDTITAIDSNVADGNVYRYVARLIYKNGLTQDFGDATIEFIQPAPGQVDTTISDLSVSHAVSPNVTFNVVTATSETDLDQIKTMLQNQGLSEFFTGDIQSQRDQLTSLIAHNIQRVDLKTGIREDFGIVTVSNFDDTTLRKNQAISPLEYGHSYRYEIYPLLRAPETMFDAFVKTSIDKVTKKSYIFSPAKFLHPLALNQGVLVSSIGASQRYTKSPMAYGIVGDVATVDVSFDDDTASIQSPLSSQFDRYTNIINWMILGDINQVDHFLIFKEVHGCRTLLGKAHSEFANGSCQYIHEFSSHDNGAITYVIIPIMNDYTVGTEALTNTLTIEAS